MDLLLKYFPKLTQEQIIQFSKLQELYKDWNLKINVVSRKDIDELYLRHVLHSLGIAKVVQFKPNTKVLDVGTGGGFPGIPLAILFPETHFHLVDSIGKKIKVVNEVAEGLGLQNISTTHGRVEEDQDTYDFIVSRAVTNMSNFVKIVNGKISSKNKNQLKNGILYLKGGDLSDELKDFKHVKSFKINSYFNDTFFDTKKIVYLPMPCTDKDIR